jgi:hypothetical protein
VRVPITFVTGWFQCKPTAPLVAIYLWVLYEERGKLLPLLK